MTRNFITPNDINESVSDIQSIMAAINLAKETGCNTVRIPRYNQRTDSFIWDLDSSIELPSDFTLILDNCHIRLADGTYCNAICNENCHKNLGEQKNIRIIGEGHVVLDGGNYNGYSEHSESLPKALYNNCMIMLHNVTGFTVENLYVTNHRYWALTFMYCSEGSIRNIEFKADLSTSDDKGGSIKGVLPEDYEHVYLQNSDGIDLRVGCHNILIENISGFTVDDTVALTALKLIDAEAPLYSVENKLTNIHDVIIRNIRSYTFCWTGQVRLLAKDGNKIYNVSVDTVINTLPEDAVYQGGCSVMIGDCGYVKDRDTVMGDIYNVSVKNIHSRAIRNMRLTGPMSYIYIENLFCYGNIKAAVNIDACTEFKSVSINGIYAGENVYLDSVFNFSGEVKGKLKISNVNCEKADYLIRKHSDSDIDIEDFTVKELVKDEVTFDERHYKYWYLDKE